MACPSTSQSTKQLWPGTTALPQPPPARSGPACMHAAAGPGTTPTFTSPSGCRQVCVLGTDLVHQHIKGVLQATEVMLRKQ